MGKKTTYTTYSPTDKLDFVEEAIKKGKASVHKNYNIPRTTLRGWMDDIEGIKKHAAENVGQRIKRLRRSGGGRKPALTPRKEGCMVISSKMRR